MSAPQMPKLFPRFHECATHNAGFRGSFGEGDGCDRAGSRTCIWHLEPHTGAYMDMDVFAWNARVENEMD
jgi:hypothetical protein